MWRGPGPKLEEGEANARLIASAPALLAALEMIRFNWAGHAEQCRGVIEGFHKCDCDWPKVAKQCDAAIRAARGEG